MAATARLRLMYRFEYSHSFDSVHLRCLQDDALERARRGVQLDPRDSVCLYAYGYAESFADNHDVATATLRDAVANNPNDPGAQMGLAIVLHRAGHVVDEVLERIDLAMRLNPRSPTLARMLNFRSVVLFDGRRYSEALNSARMANSGVYPSPGALPLIAASLSAVGKTEEARLAIKDCLRASPDMSISLLRQKPWLGSPGSREPFLDALRDAGLPK